MTNIKQQTAVEWLEIEVKKFNMVITKEYILLLCQQAKEMEKEKIIEAYHQGVTDEYGDALEFGDNTDGEVYYNEIYGNK
jgi:hypothetical protein